jgi:hypothetical protein
MQVPPNWGLRVCPFTRVIFLGIKIKEKKKKGVIMKDKLTQAMQVWQMYVSPGDPAS